MPTEVLYRKWRPQRFADVAGQDVVTRTLINALAQHKVSHAYLFAGPARHRQDDDGAPARQGDQLRAERRGRERPPRRALQRVPFVRRRSATAARST